MNRCHVCNALAVNADAALCLKCSGKADRGEVGYDPDRGWRPIETVPKDETRFVVKYDDGSEENEVYWSDVRYCILGAPQGSVGAGLVSTEAGHLPLDDPEPTHWRPGDSTT